MKKIISITIKSIELLILTAIGVIFLIVISPILPTKNYASTYVVSTGSMEPTIHVGAIVFTIKADPEGLHEGDIVSFTAPTDNKKIVIHRIVGKSPEPTNNYFITKGDNNNVQDPWKLNYSNIRGKYFFMIPYLGFATNYLKTPWGFFIGMGIPSLLLVLLQIKKIKEGIKEEVERKTKEALRKIDENGTSIRGLELVLISTLCILGTSLFVKSAIAVFSSAVPVSFAISTDKFDNNKLDLDLIKHEYSPLNEKIAYGDISNIQIFEILNKPKSKDAQLNLYFDNLEGTLCDNLDFKIFLGNDINGGEQQSFSGTPDQLSGQDNKIDISNASDHILKKNSSVYVFIVAMATDDENISDNNNNSKHKQKHHNDKTKDQCTWDTIVLAQNGNEQKTLKLKDNLLSLDVPDVDVDECDDEHGDHNDNSDHPRVGHHYRIQWKHTDRSDDHNNRDEDKRSKLWQRGKDDDSDHSEHRSYNIELYDEDGKNKITDIAKDIKDVDNYDWNIPDLDTSKKYKFRISYKYGDHEIENYSEHSFRIGDKD